MRPNTKQDFGVRHTTELESQLGNVIAIERLGRCCAVLQLRDELTELKAFRILKYPDNMYE
jgi:hypothetical protein